LTYSSNGLIVDKSSSWVGFDWALQVGGVITRTYFGFPDSPSNRLAYPEDIDTDPEELYNFMITYRKFGYTTDLQPDIFSYNFNEHTGKFALDHQGNPYFIPFDKLQIESSNNLLDFNNYTITTPDGIVYEFEESETSIYQNLYSFRSALYLTKIIHPAGDEITFHYHNFNNTNNSGIYQQHTQLLTTSGGTPPYTYDQDCYITTNTQRVVFLDSITTNGYGKVIFHQSGRTDSYLEPKLDKISIKSAQNDVIKSFSFYYSFPQRSTSFQAGTTNGIYGCPNNEYQYRMFLDSLSFNDNNDSPRQVYEFEYNNLDQLPSRFSYSQDHWGYFNGKSNSSFLSSSGVSQQFINSTSISFANKDPDWNYSKKGMLKKITYPTGGYTEITYEGNKTTNDLEVGGCRVYQVKSRESSTAPQLVKTYIYPAGNIFGLPGYYDEFTLHTYYQYEAQCVDYYHDYGIVSSCSATGLFSKQHNNIIYQYVSVYDGDESTNNGKEVSTYDYEIDVPGSIVPYSYGGLTKPLSYSNNSWINGTLLSESYYNSNGDLIKRIQYNYDEDETGNSDKISCLNANYLDAPYCPIALPDPEYLAFLSYFQTSKYYIYSKWHHLESTEVIEIDNNDDALTVTTNYLYEDTTHAQITQESYVNSLGQTIQTKYYYPDDYYNYVQNFSTLKSNFMIALPIDIRTYNGSQLISGQQMKYNNNGQVTDFYKAEVSSGGSINFSMSSPYTFTHKVNYQYLENDCVNKESPEGDIDTYYLWDSSGKYLMAKIVGGTCSWANISSLNEQDCDYSSKSLMSSLKGQTSGSLITTYSYSPLVGLQEMTDPTGVTTYYNYDSFGRLSFIKNDGNKLLEKNEYNYAN